MTHQAGRRAGGRQNGSYGLPGPIAEAFREAYERLAAEASTEELRQQLDRLPHQAILQRLAVEAELGRRGP